MPKPKIPHKNIHKIIGKIVREGRTPMDSTHWKKNTTPTIPSTGQSLNALYRLAQTRKVNKKTFFGHGDWNKYIAWLQKHPHLP